VLAVTLVAVGASGWAPGPAALSGTAGTRPLVPIARLASPLPAPKPGTRWRSVPVASAGGTYSAGSSTSTTVPPR